MGGYIPDAATGPLLVGVYVAPDHRGDAAGVSRLLLDAVERWALGHSDTLRLEVHEDNPRARRFYEKLGSRSPGAAASTSSSRAARAGDDQTAAMTPAHGRLGT